MNWSQAIVTFFSLWWLVWLMVLPFGVKQEENPDPLHDKGAPQRPNFRAKIIITTLLSAALTLAIMYTLNAGWLRLDIDDPNL